MDSLGTMFALHQSAPKKTSYMNILGQNPEFQQEGFEFFLKGSFAGAFSQVRRALTMPSNRLSPGANRLG